MSPSSSVASPEASPQPLHPEVINRATGPLGSRLASGSLEFGRVLGGGLVPGSLVLVGGDPGIGKSTLLLQSATVMAPREPVLYVECRGIGSAGEVAQAPLRRSHPPSQARGCPVSGCWRKPISSGCWRNYGVCAQAWP